MMLFPICALWIGVSGAFALQPVRDKFPAQHGVPEFSIRLGNDTASVCNSSTPGTSGFIDTVSDSHMFFWLFESKNDPLVDPVILWMTGGPGASSVGYGALMELGPCRIAPDGGYTIDNPYGWNTNATVLFVDQPTSVGFSSGESIPEGLPQASKMMDQFLRQFFTAFPQLAARDFFIAGESYGGSWVPALGAQIMSISMSVPKINLKGIMIGNGLVRQSVQNPGSFEAACSGPDSLFNTSQCLEWAPRAMWCETNLNVCETEGWKSAKCKEAEQLCSEMSQVVTGQMQRNPYDWRLTCTDPLACYKEQQYIDEYLNRTEIKTALGVDGDAPFRGVSMEIFEQWEKVGDLWKSSDSYVNYLLDLASLIPPSLLCSNTLQDIRVLIYVGDKDWYCHAAGMRRLVNQGLVWNGHPFFRFRELIPWYTGAKPAGRWKSYEPLTYAEIWNAGHLSPFDKPEEVLTLINAWIHGVIPTN
ncbi:Alpha/Beta hydrolase protein [Ilyonectria sp. MPI-CAGE-AT-0026]|nr:Alpha/Beta hydrolase protein [Ilyonectria sp. MPI-CAGE-AT-0026]